jgi:poly(A) polymerase
LPKSIWRMFEQPRFRASVDFLQLRAAAHQFDSVLAQWWMDLANADDTARVEMLEELSRLPKETSATAPRSRTRRRRRSPTSGDRTDSPSSQE